MATTARRSGRNGRRRPGLADAYELTFEGDRVDRRGVRVRGDHADWGVCECCVVYGYKVERQSVC
jgi:hypothetical protein